MRPQWALHKVHKLLTEYLLGRENYYRCKLHSTSSLQNIIKISFTHRDLPILERLILREFPQYKEQLYKYLIIQ